MIRVRQITNTKAAIKRKADPAHFAGGKGNLADSMQSVETLIHSHPLVQGTSDYKNKTTGVILYTEEQLMDFQRSCCARPLGQSTKVGVDKTLNLGPMHLTVTAFKQLAVTRKKTGENPIFLGPMFLHSIIAGLFGEQGLCKVNDEVSFDIRHQNLRDIAMNIAPACVGYICRIPTSLV